MASPQEPLASQEQKNRISTSMILQNCTFPDFMPNMVPHVAGTYGTNVGDTHTHVPEPTLQEYDSISRTAIPCSYPSGSAPPHRPEPSFSLAMAQDTSGPSSCIMDGNRNSYASKTPDGSQRVLPQHVKTHSPDGKTIQVAPVPSKASDVKFSRLPSSNVPRKAPLRGNSGSSKSPCQDISRKISKPRQKQPSSRPESSTDTVAPAQKRRRVPTKECQGTTIQSPVVLIETGRGGKGTKEDDSQESRNDQRGEGALRKKRNGNEIESDAAMPTASGRIHRGERNVTKTFLQGTKVARSTYVHSSLLLNRSVRRRPMYDYEVPLELEGIRRALGPDDWNEYVYLMESLWLNKVTAHEFEQGAKLLFRLHVESMRKKMNSIMVVKMIMPRLEQIREDLMAMPSG